MNQTPVPLLNAISFVIGCLFTLGALFITAWSKTRWTFSREWFWKQVIIWGEGGLAAAHARSKRRAVLRARLGD